MSFDWMQTPRVYQREGAAREQALKAVRERARLLCNLQRSHEEALARVKADLSWEFEGTDPSWMSEVEGVVAQVYERRQRD